MRMRGVLRVSVGRAVDSRCFTANCFYWLIDVGAFVGDPLWLDCERRGLRIIMFGYSYYIIGYYVALGKGVLLHLYISPSDFL